VALFLRRAGCESSLDDGAWKVLLDHSWPGDVRELKSVALSLASRGAPKLVALDVIEEMADDRIEAPGNASRTYSAQHDRWERDALFRAFIAGSRSWSVAAKALEISYSAIRAKVRRLGLEGCASEPVPPPADSRKLELGFMNLEGGDSERKSRAPQE
jgi:transcriptional regulator of acetoin/glycerol metabolism